MITMASLVSAMTNVGWYTMKAYTYGNYYYKRYVTPMTTNIIAMAYQHIFESKAVNDKYSFQIIKDPTTSLKKICYSSYKGAGIKFIQVMVEDGDKKYEINIDDYMIEGNILFGEGFVAYMLEEQHGISDVDENYIVHIIDHNANVVTLGIDDYITVKDSDYSQVSILHTDEDSPTTSTTTVTAPPLE